MSGLRYPNESREYRDASDSLLGDEQELIDKIKSVAEKRRNLPPGGQLKEDYVFQWALCHELRRSTRRNVTVREMEDGPSSSAIRCRSQATASCCLQKRRW